ncbi:MAG: hypothetical protein RLZZ607_1221 [Pseudomonadota bacterium]|jgi:hypothetical protein
MASEVGTNRASAAVWIFRVLVVAAAAYMVYTWFAPWWGAKVAVLPGEDHLVLHPWGIEAVAQIRANSDESLYSMPWFFAPFMWTYLTVCMLALAASLFVDRTVSIGRIKLPLATVLIGLVGVSYFACVSLAYAVGELRAGWAGSNFIGKSMIHNSTIDAKIKMTSALKIGYWLALYSGPALIFLALIRGLFVRKPKV